VKRFGFPAYQYRNMGFAIPKAKERATPLCGERRSLLIDVILKRDFFYQGELLDAWIGVYIESY
jgi:hypothetical protein